MWKSVIEKNTDNYSFRAEFGPGYQLNGAWQHKKELAMRCFSYDINLFREKKVFGETEIPMGNTFKKAAQQLAVSMFNQFCFITPVILYTAFRDVIFVF